VSCNHWIGGYEKSGNENMRDEMIELAREQLKSKTSLASGKIRILSFESQIVSGTNYRLVFTVGDKHQCTLVVYKPLPFKKQNLEVTSFTCIDI